MAWIPAAIGAAASVAGGLLGRENARDNVAMQKEFAQHGIRWKVEDAKAAGIHPLYALGAQTHSFSPVSTGTGDALAAAGQDIGRAIHAQRTAGERREAETTAFIRQAEMDAQARDDRRQRQERHASDLQTAELNRALLASQIAKLNASPSPPMPGSTGTTTVPPGRELGLIRADQVAMQPAKVTSHSSALPSVEAGTRPGMVRYRVGNSEIDLPGQELGESMESMPLGGWMVTGKHYWDKWGSKPFPKFDWYQWNKERQPGRFVHPRARR